MAVHLLNVRKGPLYTNGLTKSKNVSKSVFWKMSIAVSKIVSLGAESCESFSTRAQPELLDCMNTYI